VLEAGVRYRAGVDHYGAQAAEQAVIARAYANLEGDARAGVPRAPGPVVGSRCPACGAPTLFEAGALLSHCGYCGASLLAAAETRTRGLDEAARAARATRLEALTRERRFAVGLAQKYRIMGLWKRWCFVVILPVAALAFSLSDRPDIEEKAPAMAGASVLALLGVLVVSLWRRARLGRAAAALRGIAAGADGSELRGTGAIAGWLNHHWWDAYPVYDLSFTFESPAAAASLRGLPVLAIAAPLTVNDEPFLDVLASAWYDGRSDRGEGPASKGDANASRALQEQGFTVEIGPSGVRARLSGDACRRRLATDADLNGVADLVARLALSAGGRAASRLTPGQAQTTASE